jgi:hypothetical protein
VLGTKGSIDFGVQEKLLNAALEMITAGISLFYLLRTVENVAFNKTEIISSIDIIHEADHTETLDYCDELQAFKI